MLRQLDLTTVHPSETITGYTPELACSCSVKGRTVGSVARLGVDLVDRGVE